MPLQFDVTPVANNLIPPSPGTDYEAISYFPWRFEDCSKLHWDGFIWSDELRSRWRAIIRKWTGVAAVCGRNINESKVLLLRTTPKTPLQILGEMNIDVKSSTKEGIRAMCWSLHPKTLDPLLLLGGLTANIYVYDISSRSLISVLRGHGGRITSLHAHPSNPQLVVSTSLDTTARIWKMNLTPETILEHSDPKRVPLGPPFGAPLTNGEPEATGLGRCVLVTEGGMPSEGHKGTVLDADFHPTLNLLATSSEDHSIRIWLYEPMAVLANGSIVHTNLTRPVFATDKLHPAAVVCVHWLSNNILISQSIRSVAVDTTFPGRIMVWKWLGRVDAALANGCEYAKTSLDATDSYSFKILAEIPIVQEAAKLTFSEKLAILTTNSLIRIIDPFQFQPRKAPEPLKGEDLPYTDSGHERWQENLVLEKERQNSVAPDASFPGVVATIETVDDLTKQDKEFSTAMHHGMLLRVGTNQSLIVWNVIGI